MLELLKTTTTNKHWHAISVDFDTQELYCSVDNDHVHELVIGQDPLSGQPIVMIMEEENHSHDPEPIESPLPENPKDKPDKEIVDHAINLFKRAARLEADSRKKAKESVAFFEGDQWDKNVEEHLKSKQRATQVLNYVQAKIDVLSGLARQNRVDPRAYPVEGSDNGVADVVTATLCRIGKQSRLATEEIQTFEDEIITGRGLFHVGITQERNPLGDIFIERFPWEEGYFGPHMKLDAADATHCHKAPWISFDEAQARYPDKADSIESQTLMNPNINSDMEPISLQADEDSSSSATIQSAFTTDPELIDIKHRRVRLIEHEIREFRTASFVVNEDGSFYVEVDKATADKAKTLPGLTHLTFPRSRIRVVVTVGEHLIKNHYPPRPYEGFSLVPVYAYKSDSGNFWGKLQAMKDAQREINKRSSQAIDIVNRMLGRGWFYDSETFSTPKQANQFKQISGGAGWHQEIASTERPPKPAEQPSFPTELLTMHQLNVSILDGVSNISQTLHGQSKTGYESAAARQQETRGSLVGNERVFDNFILSKQTVFKKVFKLVQEYYKPERIARIVLSEASDPGRSEQMQLQGQPIPMQRDDAMNQQILQDIVTMLETKDLSEYDIQIGEQPFSATAREGEFLMWMEAARQGITVPPQMLVELSSLPKKAKWAEVMQQMQEQQMQMEAEKHRTELEKSGRIPVQSNTGAQQ